MDTNAAPFMQRLLPFLSLDLHVSDLHVRSYMDVKMKPFANKEPSVLCVCARVCVDA